MTIYYHISNRSLTSFRSGTSCDPSTKMATLSSITQPTRSYILPPLTKTSSPFPQSACTTPISHFVMNLPASAIDFLGSFNGLYHGHEKLFEPHTSTKLPMVHVHCFSTKSEDNVKEGIEICERISEKLRYVVKPGDTELVIHEVRDVAPKKRMFCASFRLPREVAFRERIAR
jgi:tRNA (guanine37-N1)-methyltransferase